MAHEMFHIFAKILDHQSSASMNSWMASDLVADVQRDFQSWETMLPDHPNDPSASRERLGQLTLRMYYAGVQMLLYAPCTHHLAGERCDPTFDVDGFTFG